MKQKLARHLQPQPQPHELERILALARDAQPRELSSTDVRRLVRQSAVAAVERRDDGRHHGRVLLLVAGMGCALVLGLWSPWRDVKQQPPTVAAGPTVQAANWSPLELALPTGDHLSASPGARFELVQSTALARRIALREGTVVFAVKPLASGETFRVQTPHVLVEVRGTVFSVEVDGARTRVRVHEGAVQVLGTVQPRTLRAGERFGTDGVAVPELSAAPLARRARELVEERARSTASGQDGGAAAGPGHEPPAHEPARPKAAVASSPLSIEQARALLLAGDAPGALAAAQTVKPHELERGEWLLLAADALRSLGRAREAVATYLEAEPLLLPEARAGAAFKAADLSLRVLDDPTATLGVLNRARLDSRFSPLRERAMVLRIEAAQRLGLPVRALAERYLDAYPDSAGAAHLRALTAEPTKSK